MAWDGTEKRKEDSNLNTQIAVLTNDIGYIKKTVEETKKLIEDKYVTKAEFDPIKRIVYGVVSLILIGVVGALISLVVRR